MVRWLSDDEQATWSAFIRMRQRLDAAMAAGLARDGLSMPDYEILVALSAAPGDCLRAKDLAAEICWDKSRLSKHVARMDSRGLVGRSPAADDARGIVVRLTERGRRALEEAAPNHVELVRRLFMDVLTDAEAEAVRSLADKVVTEAERSAEIDAA
ncbi:MarR family winged helix-turn-helix transcriptional regulator [Nocardia pseudobrasiliensis]|uniref:MarR family transcriptional regulator n=1 Tax=Nocardia pseudobrasiliensis TaxID=45979 RepID=A0A370HW88_9NOCA|nr:MarR family winged helix-turn-helix transcriptional regulator [Nocardia pseudobrasiliensis]RDI62752.1 MarR family transcriptional regulator [Nocardia pseudobrasiliensis]